MNRTEYFYIRSQAYFIFTAVSNEQTDSDKISISNTYRGLNKNMNFEKSDKALKCSYISSRESRIKYLEYSN